MEEGGSAKNTTDVWELGGLRSTGSRSLKRGRGGAGRGGVRVGAELSSRPLCSHVFKTLPNSTTVPGDPLPPLRAAFRLGVDLQTFHEAYDASVASFRPSSTADMC